MKNKKNIIILILLFSVAIISTLFTTTGLDYYWHITAGKYMFNNNTILTKDIFSWILYNKNWISHEWLFEVIIYSFKLLFGNLNIIIYCFINIFILLVIIFFNNKNYKKNTLFTIFWLMLFVIMNSYSIIPRPHLISNVFFALTLYLLYNLKNNEYSNKIYLLPIISILWANIHGGSSNLSYILIIIFIFTGLIPINNKYIESKKITKLQLKKYSIVLVLCLLALNINPHGFKMIIYPYENILNSLMQQNITEWQPILKITPNNYIYICFILLLSIIIIKSKKKIKFTDLILAIIFIILGIKSFRFSNYIYIVSSFFIFDYIKERKDDKNTSIILLFSSIILITLFLISFPSTQKRINSNYISDKMISKIKEENPKRLFNLYDYGGYLVSKNIKVFIDGRADLYSNYNYKDYIDIFNNVNRKKLIDKYKFDYFLVDDRYNITKYLNDNKYELISKDNNIVLYKKKDTSK